MGGTPGPHPVVEISKIKHVSGNAQLVMLFVKKISKVFWIDKEVVPAKKIGDKKHLEFVDANDSSVGNFCKSLQQLEICGAF